MISPSSIPQAALPVPSATRKFSTQPPRGKIMVRLRRAFSLHEGTKANVKQRTETRTTIPPEAEKFRVFHAPITATKRCETPVAHAFSPSNHPPSRVIPVDRAAGNEKMLLENMPGFHTQNALLLDNGPLTVKARPAPEILTQTTLLCRRGSFAPSTFSSQSTIRPTSAGPIGRLNAFLYANMTTTATDTSFARLKHSLIADCDFQKDTDTQNLADLNAQPPRRSPSPSDYYFSPAWHKLNIPTKSILKSIDDNVLSKDQDFGHDSGILLPLSPTTSDYAEKSPSNTTSLSPTQSSKRCCFCESVLVGKTFAAVEYDRRGFDSDDDSDADETDSDGNPDLIRQVGRLPTGTSIYKALWRMNKARSKNKKKRTDENKGFARRGNQGFTRLEATQIKIELNDFKRYEMAVHEQSRQYTHFFPS